MGDIPSPQTASVQTAEPQGNKITLPAASTASPPKSTSAAAPSRRRPSSTRQSSYGHTGTPFPEQFDRQNVVSPPAHEAGPFNMAPMAGALPHGGYQHPLLPGGHAQYSQHSPPVMQHMPQNPYVGHHPGSMMMLGYYYQQPQMHQYYPNLQPNHHGPLPMQGRGHPGYYPVPFVMEHPQSPGYYPQPPQFPEPAPQRPDIMNRRYSQGQIHHQGWNQPRRSSRGTSKSFRDQPSPPIDAKRQQQQNAARGPPRKPHQSGHAIWIGNLPPQTELLTLVQHVCELAPGLQSLFLISKSNCAFANFKEDTACIQAQNVIHESKFQSVRLVCRLRKSSTEAALESHVVIVDGTSNPTSPTLASDPNGESRSPTVENPDLVEAVVAQLDKKAGNAHRDRFFVLKSLTREDMEQSVKTSIWATQSHNEQLLNNAFKSTDNVYLIFSANKSGEYFGFARMTSEINQDPSAAIQLAPQNQATIESDLPQAVSIEAKGAIPKGHVIDDSTRGTMFWEIDGPEHDGEAADENEATSHKEEEDVDEDLQTQGKPFHLQWLSIVPLPFYRTRGLRNPWNSNREVKIARDGTELEPSVGRRLIGLMNNNSNVGRSSGCIPAYLGPNGHQ
ncbi:YTH domain protein [Cordyceps fumosorosea ARSEF 2679]|uniref:YTH domain protein n=1 Tax=Cordyceps fumosorosea (strain ARSEF 2679) TaxID=1081104 RepID=A0A167XFB5_CORFA|nr:YTH domain protein [Cordyceps fumosorosea ARSEF 2679]OAA64911.1 YTH domain protein [Cordyceps fumosorosea ARSEF 2679]